MRAVNLVPADARRGRGAGGGRRPSLPAADALGPAHLIVAVLVIAVVIVFMRVLADNQVNDRKATLAAVQSQVATEQAQAARLSQFTSFVQSAQAREAQVRQVAQQRFPWQRTLDQISRVMPASTSLTSLNATTAASTPAAGTGGGGGPSFTLAGCADTPNQNGVATLLRRLQALSGVNNVGFQSSTRQASCGNSFNLVLNFGTAGLAAPGAATATSAVAPSGTASSVATTATSTSPTPAPPAGALTTTAAPTPAPSTTTTAGANAG